MNKKINLVPQSSTSWADLFGITVVAGMEAEVLSGGPDGAIYVRAIWNGAGAITTANYVGFPKGSKIEDFQANKTWYKKTASGGADTWGYTTWS